MTLPDVHSRRSHHDYRLTHVGVTGVVKPVMVKRPLQERAHQLAVTFNAYVDLPSDQRGSHMSRNLEAINTVLDDAVRNPVPGVEAACETLVRTLLELHPYATRAGIEAETTFFLERHTPSGRPTLEPYGLVATAEAERNGPARKSVGVTVTGITACPCAMETTRTLLEAEGIDVGDGPSVTHNQRNETLLLLDVPSPTAVDAADLVALVEDAMSAPTFELLKRGDEAKLVLQAHRNPRFVEDVVREVLARVVKQYGHLPPDAVILVRSEAQESIHKHNAFAERVTTLGDLLGPGR